MTITIKPYADRAELSFDGGNVALKINADGSVHLPAAVEVDTAEPTQLVTAQAVIDYTQKRTIYRSAITALSGSTVVIPVPNAAYAKRITVNYINVLRSGTSAVECTLASGADGSGPQSATGSTSTLSSVVATTEWDSATYFYPILVRPGTSSSAYLSGRITFSANQEDAVTPSGYPSWAVTLQTGAFAVAQTQIGAGNILQFDSDPRFTPQSVVLKLYTGSQSFTFGSAYIEVEC